MMCATPLAFFHTAIGISTYQGRCPFLLLSLIRFLIWNYTALEKKKKKSGILI